MALNHQPNIANQDAFYAELIRGQQDLSDEQADMMIAATAQVHALTVVTLNEDNFRGCGIPVLNPFSL